MATAPTGRRFQMKTAMTTTSKSRLIVAWSTVHTPHETSAFLGTLAQRIRHFACASPATAMCD